MRAGSLLHADDAGLIAQHVVELGDLGQHVAHALLARGVGDVHEIHLAASFLPRCTTEYTLTLCLANTPAIAASTPERSATLKRM